MSKLGQVVHEACERVAVVERASVYILLIYINRMLLRHRWDAIVKVNSVALFYTINKGFLHKE
jgi:hypothetical protein